MTAGRFCGIVAGLNGNRYQGPVASELCLPG